MGVRDAHCRDRDREMGQAVQRAREKNGAKESHRFSKRAKKGSPEKHLFEKRDDHRREKGAEKLPGKRRNRLDMYCIPLGSKEI